MADRHGRVAGQRHVDAVARPGGCRARRPRAPRCAARAAPRAPGAPRWPPCRPGRAARAAARRSSAACWSARTCGRGSGRAAPRARRPSRRRRSPPRPPRGARARSGRWAAAILFASSYSATVAAIATLSESGPSARSGMRARPRRLGSSPAGPRARRPGRARRGGARARARPASRSPRASSATRRARQLRRSRRAPAAARTASPCSPAPPSGENGSAQPGPEDHGAVAERVRRADDRAHVAGVVDAVQVDAQRRRPAPTSAAGRRRSRACPTRAS